MNKLTNSQVAALNIINDCLHQKWQQRNSEDARDVACTIARQYATYKETHDRNDIPVLKEHIEQLYEIFKKAKEEW